MLKKITTMRLMRYRIMIKERFFYIFRLGKPRVANLIPGIDSLRNCTLIHIDYIVLKIFFYRSTLLVAKVAKKKNFCSKEMATKIKTSGVETPKKQITQAVSCESYFEILTYQAATSMKVGVLLFFISAKYVTIFFNTK